MWLKKKNYVLGFNSSWFKIPKNCIKFWGSRNSHFQKKIEVFNKAKGTIFGRKAIQKKSLTFWKLINYAWGLRIEYVTVHNIILNHKWHIFYKNWVPDIKMALYVQYKWFWYITEILEFCEFWVTCGLPGISAGARVYSFNGFPKWTIFWQFWCGFLSPMIFFVL